MNKQYVITETQLKMINILITVIEESINRKTFSEQEIKKIIKTVDILNSYPKV
tara:strand:- start:7732 stop:7890 length:159 start_codon:yes stop_codon:yes gene_type:complete